MTIQRVLAIAVAGLVAGSLIGCGPGALKKDEKIVTLQAMQISGESVWSDGTTEGFKRDVPKGAVFNVLYDQRQGSNFVECQPAEVNGLKDPEQLRQFFLPMHLQSREGLVQYSISLEISDLGTKYDRVAAAQ